MTDDFEELRRRAGITEYDQLDEDIVSAIAKINPKLARSLSTNIRRRHFAYALSDVAKQIENGDRNPINKVAQAYGLDTRTLQDYVRAAGITIH